MTEQKNVETNDHENTALENLGDVAKVAEVS